MIRSFLKSFVSQRIAALCVALLGLSAAAFAACTNCGQVTEVRTVKIAGQGSGVGAVAGGVAGGLLGNQIGRGTGKTLATVAGAGGGAYAGHQVEKKVREHTEYQVIVRMDGGDTRTVKYTAKPAFLPGDRVQLDNGTLTRVAP